MNTNQINKRSELINYILSKDDLNFKDIIFEEFAISIIQDYDIKTFNNIEYQYIRLYLIIYKLFKIQYVESLYLLKNLIVDNHYYEDDLSFNQDIQNYKNRIKKTINNKKNENNNKFKLFKQVFKIDINEQIKDIIKNIDNIHALNKILYSVMMFYIAHIKCDYNESNNECDILELMVLLNKLIYMNIHNKCKDYFY
jgi:hypothetical protein